MMIAVVADLVPAAHDALGHRRMRLHRPAGDEESRAQSELAQQFQQHGGADARFEAAEAHGDQAFGM